MKTKPISIRFDEDDLVLAQRLSGIKKHQKLVDLLIAEYVKSSKTSPIRLPKDFMSADNPKDSVPSVRVTDHSSNKPKSNYTIDTTQKETLPMPEKQPGEDAIDFAIRKNEWKQLNNK